ncbi:MFS transporter [Amycolatopsis oliviviridis]|uniref:MFS transporter n=1 Tax=Amycolatopsis oliviviridis TaxID=1471590 RepID=A0ABQ3M849_9PSEU|nr:MFS transporter [Amycolatopsis oliviviridis]GHH36191.1 MFS transporter [Amycolatopsis oliviviridis]
MHTDPRRWRALALLCTANFMVILDSQIVVLAVPSIERDLGFDGGGTHWVLSAYLLSFGLLLLPGGRAADLLGRRRTFSAGTALFLLSSLWCGFAWSDDTLIAARVLQGISAALMAPSALALVMTTFTDDGERTKALAAWSGVGGFGATAALLIGGTLTRAFGWEWVFFLNVPVALALLVATPALLSESRDVSRRGAPLIPLRIFSSRMLTGGNLVMLTSAMGAFAVSFLISRYAQEVLGYSPLLFGVATAVLPVMAVAGAYGGQALIPKIGLRGLAVAGTVLLGAGCLALAGVSPDGTYLTDLLPGLAAFGLGLGAATVAAPMAALGGVDAGDTGLASGITTAAFQLGGALGVSVASAVSAAITGTATSAEAVTGGFRVGFVTAACFAALGLAIALSALRPGKALVMED